MNGDTSESLFEGILHPKKIPGFIRRNYEEAKLAVKFRRLSPQREKLEELLKEGRFVLVILDSCRFDYFESEYSEYFRGDLEPVFTTNTATKQYLARTWSQKTDLTYVAGGPVITDRTFELSDSEYRPSDHFAEIVDVWDMEYERKLGVTPPEAVTKEALKCDADRMVVHYFQPHAPYIGEVRLRSGDDIVEDQSHLETRVESLKKVYDMARSGQIDESSLREAYASNLRRVLKATTPLVQQSDRRVVFTADHGELLGENGRLFHGGLPHPVLCKLPWLEIDSVKGGVIELPPVVNENEENPERTIKEQLQDLGYM